MMQELKLDVDVLTAARQRICNISENGLPVYLSFSGGKDTLALAHVSGNPLPDDRRLPRITAGPVGDLHGDHAGHGRLFRAPGCVRTMARRTVRPSPRQEHQTRPAPRRLHRLGKGERRRPDRQKRVRRTTRPHARTDPHQEWRRKARERHLPQTETASPGRDADGWAARVRHLGSILSAGFGLMANWPAPRSLRSGRRTAVGGMPSGRFRARPSRDRILAGSNEQRASAYSSGIPILSASPRSIAARRPENRPPHSVRTLLGLTLQRGTALRRAYRDGGLSTSAPHRSLNRSANCCSSGSAKIETHSS